MKPSPVYYTTLRCAIGDSLLDKLTRLAIKAGIDAIDLANKFCAIKIHFGEPGNLAFLRPNYAAAIVALLKERGARPFLTDCNTLYVGGRKHALDHIESAYRNGFTPYTTGCHIIIADGLKGNDEVEVEVPGGQYVQRAKIGRALMDSDVIITLSHFKGHEATGFGGTLKNLGMGGGSRAGKMEMHCDGKPVVDATLCIGCGNCIAVCAHDAPAITDGICQIDHAACVGCGRCLAVCPTDAISNPDDSSNDKLNCKISEYAWAIAASKPTFHITLVIDVSPDCDCHAENDAAIVGDIGFYASFDPVALDQACIDAVNNAPINANSKIGRREATDDHFTTSHPTTNWRVGLEHAQRLGLGTTAYHLIEVQ
ncbi:MAG: DUF362 domain-containing protein [Sphaerochaeta sp.]|jgi:uncharacterized Fe-S center protein|nr:DUF362 domain-containing protein [Sphaerochaeta sp.]